MKNVLMSLMMLTSTWVFAADKTSDEVNIYVMTSVCDSANESRGNSTYINSKSYHLKLSDFANGTVIKKSEKNDAGEMQTEIKLSKGSPNRLHVKSKFISKDGSVKRKAQLSNIFGDAARVLSGLCEESSDAESLNVMISVD